MQMLWDLRREVSGKVNGAIDGLKSGEADGVKLGVVGNLDGTCNGFEEREGDVRKGRVSNQCQATADGSALGDVTDGGQVGSLDALGVGSVESKGAVDGGQRREADGRDVSESGIGGPDQVREADIQVLSVGRDIDELGDVRNLGAEGLETVVVVDVQGANGLQVDAIKGAQERVGDEHRVGLGEGRREGELRESRKRGPLDSLDRGQIGHGEGGQKGQVVESECTTNRADGGAAQAGQLARVLADDVTLDLLRAIDVDNTRDLVAEDDAARNGGAAGELRSIGSGVEGNGRLRADVG